MFNWKDEHNKKLRMLKFVEVPKRKSKLQLKLEWLKFLMFGMEKKGVKNEQSM